LPSLSLSLSLSLRRRIAFAALSLVSATMLTAALPVAAAAADPAQAITTRQDNFKLLGKTAKALKGQFQGGAPDRAAVTDEANTIAKLAAALPSWFPAGSGPNAGVKTAAKAEIWTQAVDFKKASDNLTAQANKLAQLAASGDMAATGVQAKQLSQACGDCHHQFKVKGD
jgi:cytochrome c556